MKTGIKPRVQVAAAVTPLNTNLERAYSELLPEQDRGNELGKLAWRMLQNPAGPGLVSHALMGDRVVGMSTYVPANIDCGKRTVVGYQAIDSIVDPQLRGQGIFTRLASEFWESVAQYGGELVYGFPNENAAPAWFGSKLSWTRLAPPPFVVKPLRLGYLLRRFGLPGDLPLSLVRDEGAPTITRFDDRADEVWARLQSDHQLKGVRRSSRYLNWRIFDCPSVTYRVVGSGDSYVCSWSGSKHGGRIGYVMEALGAEGGDLLRSELGRMRDEGVEVVLAWSPAHSPNHRHFQKAGFVSLPERLRPIAIHFGLRPHSAAAAGLAEQAGWYLSYLDSDTV